MDGPSWWNFGWNGRIVRSEELGVRSGGGGAQYLEAPQSIYNKGYYSAESFCVTNGYYPWPRGKRVIKGYGASANLITFYNPF